ncbi:hypothetical protein V5799_022838 [Amblyomma americanum]|uniref:Uncharacterized protein n=1 Tax=Amblyomma americanum TaxID=6943 RepID=A0AAQ4FJG8_AMBAM
MADSRQGGPTNSAAAAYGMEGTDGWELLPKGGGDCPEAARATLRNEQRHRRRALNEPINSANGGRGYLYDLEFIPFRLLPWAATVHKTMYAFTFGYLPFITFLHSLLIPETPLSLPPLPVLPEKMWLPAFFLLMCLFHAGTDIIMYTVTIWMRQFNLGTPFGVFLHIKLLFRLSLFIPAKYSATLLTLGIKVRVELSQDELVSVLDQIKDSRSGFTYPPNLISDRMR